MGQQITPLLFEEEHLVRQVEEDGRIGFVGLDACRILEIAKPHQALDRLDPDERGTCSVGTPGGVQSMIVVWEEGLYRLIFASRKPVAERLKRWLAHDVMPSIRKTGGYGQSPEGIQAQQPEARIFPDWPMDELRTKRGVVDAEGATRWLSPPSPPSPPRSRSS